MSQQQNMIKEHRKQGFKIQKQDIGELSTGTAK